MIHDYTRKRGIVHSEILLPPNAPPDFQDRGTLWNSVEQIEKACNSQLARELEVALPIELSREEQVRLIRAYCSSQFVSRGMCADFNIHDTGSGNPHAHILLTMRPMDERGKWLPKSKKEYVLDENGERIRLSSGRYKTRKVDLVDWNSQENAEVWRKVWADLANEYLAQNNRPERIDHRSYERQGIDQIPTVHIGVAASQMPTIAWEERKDTAPVEFTPYKPKIQKPGTGCVTMINDHLYEGRYTPTNAYGKRESLNIYAKTREECKEKLAEMIAEVKAQIKAEKERLKAEQEA